MFDFLKDHPFAVEAYFEQSIVLTFAVPKEEISSLIPECLTLDTFQDKWAFIAVAMVETKGLRPKGTPKFMGNDFFLIGYRVFVRYTNQEGKRLRGLYILKSETDKKKMAFFGNIFTHYNYTTTDIQQVEGEESIEISSVQSRFHLVLDKRENNINLPEDSPFLDWKEARRYAGPLPFTFTYNEDSRQVLIIEGVRQNWTPNPIQIKNYQFDYLKTLHLKNPILANAFIIKNIPYYWKKGKKEQWK
ncbi:MAG: DUF2071 domain-containing protein [Flavobacteriales bacterium]